MKKIYTKRILPAILAFAIISGYTIPSSVMAFEAPEADTGSVSGITNAGEWSIYASRTGSTRESSIISDTTDKGTAEVTGGTNIGAQLQFDLSTLTNNSAADGKVVKSAVLRLTPMVSRQGIEQTLYIIDNEFNSTDMKTPVCTFTVPRRSTNDFFADSEITALSSDLITEYPSALAEWQTALDITGEVISSGDVLSVDIEYSSGNTEKTEYATSNIDNNARLNTGKVPLLYNSGITDYSKWVYPQIVLEYSDEEIYKNAQADFIQAYNELNNATVTDDSPLTLSQSVNGSSITLEMYDINPSPIKTDGNSLSINEEYVGNESMALVRLTSECSDGAETARYSRVVSVKADYTRPNTISFDASKNAKGEISVYSGGNQYSSGTAYAKAGDSFYIEGGANTGYTADITVVNDTSGETVEQNPDGSYTMPDANVNIIINYTKKIFGTSRIAALNSASVKSDGNIQGGTASSPNIVIGAGRLTFLKFDLSGYNKDMISNAEISFSGWNTANTKALFYVPNCDWDESTLSKNFCLDGTDMTSISAFSYTEDEKESTVSLLNGEGVSSLIMPDAEDASTAANGILKDYYVGSSGTYKSDVFDVTDAIKSALEQSNDNTFTLLVYSAGGGRDAISVMFAQTITERPSLTITESSANLPDEELITEISTIEELETFANIVNGGNSYSGKTVSLKNDIDLSGKYNSEGSSWTPIGFPDNGTTRQFAGTFEGNGNTISGLYINGNGKTLGLFGTVTGTISNLNVDGEITGSSVIGGIAAWCSGKIADCSSDVDIHAQREAGGITGTLTSGGNITGCDNTGNIVIEDKESYAGGIAAHSMGYIESCINYGSVTNGMNGFRNKLGGIVGYLDTGVIKSCDNYGDVKSEAIYSSYVADTTQNYTGGIAGYSSYGTISDSDNSGTVYNKVDYSGGIAGYLQNGDTVSFCTNTGSVTGADFVGGIAGYIGSSKTESCINNGKVTGSGEAVGGVAGYLSTGIINNCSFDNVINNGLNIVGSNSAGTVTGSDVPDSFDIMYSDNAATVSASEAGVYIVVFAAYNGDGILISTDIESVEFTDAGTQTISPQYFTTDGAETVKVMLWNSISNMIPLCNCYEASSVTK